MKDPILKGIFLVNLILLLFPVMAFSAISSKVLDSIVFISSTKIGNKAAYSPVVHKGMGPGFILDKGGHIITHESIIADIHSIECSIPSLGYWPGVLVGSDKLTGVCVIKIKAPKEILKKLRPLVKRPKRKQLRLGQEIVVIGVNPDGRHILHSGIISCPTRSILLNKSSFQVVQISVFIHRGLIGGPVLDLKGRLLGMAFSPLTNLPPNEGFFIQSEDLFWITSKIIENGKVIRTYLGARFLTVTPLLKRLLNLPVDRGVLVVGVDDKSPAQRAGLLGATRELRLGNRLYPLGGDLIVAIDRIPVKNDKDLIRVLNKKGPDKKVLISFYRNGRLKRKEVILEGR